MYKLACKLFMAATLLGCTVAKAAEDLDTGVQVIIAGDTGGNIVKYALQAAAYKSARSTLQVNGNCDSACTIYLSLPANQICVTPTANFRFHAPMAANKRAALAAHDFVRGKYPKWVTAWIDSNGGLTAKLITMDFAYARKHLPVCDVQTAAK
jgi:hypothetical protein